MTPDRLLPHHSVIDNHIMVGRRRPGEVGRRPGRRPGGGQEEAGEASREDSREESKADFREEPG